MFQIKLTIVALAAVFLLAGQANALADNNSMHTSYYFMTMTANPGALTVDACNGDNHYDLGHSCAFKGDQGKSEGTCQYDGANSTVLICQTGP
ncbi:hypothetical protein EDD18DRAFT_1350472 [Armillaria luteobubalina]|uniref:Cyanovirin-N domain-containing protein n=1 Tax=Armillaria luteobubalina TaxID=153913 RepID=A0AA39Q9Z9_9AGAR|nr:hypothetical protein EDD18DRAFT_1350472 [Armillaria luteobubalina]